MINWKVYSFYNTIKIVIVKNTSFLLFIAMILFVSQSFIPFVSIEGFEAMETSGINYNINNPAVKLDEYNYINRPGRYVITEWISGLTGLNAMNSSGILSIFSFLTFIIYGMLFLKRITGANIYICGIAMLLFPALSSARSFPNSQTYALPFLFAGLYYIGEKPTLRNYMFSSFLFALSATMRIDILAMLPLILLVLISQKNNYSSSVKHTLNFALFTALFVVVFYQYLDLNIIQSIKESNSSTSYAGLWNLLKITSITTVKFMSVVTMTFYFVGLLSLIKHKKYVLFLICTYPMIALAFVYKSNLVESRFMVISTIFLAVSVIEGLKQLFILRKRMLLICSIAIGSLFFCGIALIIIFRMRL